MNKDRYLPVRVWIENKMEYPKSYTFIQYVNAPICLRFVRKKVPIKTGNFMMPVICENKIFHEQDIVTAKINGKTITGYIEENTKLCGYVIKTSVRPYLLGLCEEVTLKGNTYEHPDLLEALDTAEPISKKEVTQPAKFDKENIIIYTDGSCIRNPGSGGAAYIILAGNQMKKDAIWVGENVTNNQCEMIAAVKALEALPYTGCTVTLHSDSQYLTKGFTENYVEKWKANDWKTVKGGAVKNQNLWEKLDELNNLHKINWVWIEGHDGNKYNEECDKMARLTAERKVVNTI